MGKRTPEYILRPKIEIELRGPNRVFCRESSPARILNQTVFE